MSDTESSCEFLNLNQMSLEDLEKTKKTANFQIEVRLRKNVPKSITQSRASDIASFLRERIPNARNWKPVVWEQQTESISDIDAETSPVSFLLEKILIGSCQVNDGERLEEYIDSILTASNNIHTYKLNADGPFSQNIGDEEDNIVGSQLWQLPCVEFENIFENLIYDSNLKNEILSYVYALIHLSEKHVNSKIISVNRLILLTGPPGTGKTSLCKGIAQHLAIRLNNRYSHSVMFEINSHSLFSKWFSESGKLVQSMFDQIYDLAEDPKTMVFVLIDEVESLGMCRENSSSRGEPADAIRAVNALLTQIDRVRRKENVLILCTSNLENSLDRALIDRADIVRNVGEPSSLALYSILKSCVNEMIRIKVVTAGDHEVLEDVTNKDIASINKASRFLLEIANKSRGLSGRAITMLPTVVCSKSLDNTMDLRTCLEYFDVVVKERKMRQIDKH